GPGSRRAKTAAAEAATGGATRGSGTTCHAPASPAPPTAATLASRVGAGTSAEAAAEAATAESPFATKTAAAERATHGPALQLGQPLFGPHQGLLGLHHRLLQFLDLGAGLFDLVAPCAFAALGPRPRGVLVF